jgi:uncharacterized protein (DUF433 family)
MAEPYRDCRWIVSDPDLLGGKLAVRGTRFSVSFILSCLAEGMTADEIRGTYGWFPPEAIQEVLGVASEFEGGRTAVRVSTARPAFFR